KESRCRLKRARARMPGGPLGLGAALDWNARHAGKRTSTVCRMGAINAVYRMGSIALALVWSQTALTGGPGTGGGRAGPAGPAQLAASNAASPTPPSKSNCMWIRHDLHT